MQEQGKPARYQGLEGIRGYAFLVVFLVHYTTSLDPKAVAAFALYAHSHWWTMPWLCVLQVAWMAVPIFFVLSGFLITGILYDSRNRRKFFQVFYGRRAMRILPLYYLVVAAVGVLVVLNHGRLNPSYFTYFIYMQNMHHDWIGNFQPFLNLNHLWSLAVEEQYYLLWPVVVWLVWRREWLLGVCYTVIFLGLIAGILWPYTGLSYDVGYYSTLTRCGALMMGAALALHQRSPAMKLETLELPAKMVLAAGFACILIKFFCRGSALPCTYSGVAFLIPLTNLMSAAVVVLAILPGNRLYRCCIQPWAISLGNLSYGLYVLHYVAYDFFFTCLPGLLHPILGSIGARAVSGCFAFSITYLGAKLSYHLLELPAMRMKDRLRYGEREETATEPLLRLADATRTALHGLEHLPQRLISRPAAISRSF